VENVEKITKEDLQQKIFEVQPDNEDPKKGFALVNVLSKESFDEEHVPHSINIPKGREDEYAQRFDKEKEIIVYCSSSQCKTSLQVAQTLKDQGFKSVKHYKGGMREWKDSGHQAESSAAIQ